VSRRFWGREVLVGQGETTFSSRSVSMSSRTTASQQLPARGSQLLDEVIDLRRVPETCRIGRRFEVTQGNVAMIDIV
jgi:hypothetical protein